MYFFEGFVSFLIGRDLPPQELKEQIIGKCEKLLPRDIEDNKKMGRHGASFILKGTFKLFQFSDTT